MKEYKSIQEVAQDVLAIQDASNLQAVLGTWHAMCHTIREHASALKLERWEKHPCMVAMISKVTSLMAVNADCLGTVEGYCSKRSSTVELTGHKLWDNLHALAEGKELKP